MPDAVAPVVEPVVPVVAPVVAPAIAPWYQGADAETLGHIQNRGWQDKPANEVALAAVAAHRAAEKLIGVPADKVLRLPADVSDEAGWKAVWSKLGAPETPDKYDFSTVKFNGQPLDATKDADFIDYMRTKVAAATNMPAAMATQVAQAVASYVEGKVAFGAAEQSAALEKGKQALATNWGANAEANAFVANQGIAKLGLSPELVAAMQSADYAGAMEAFRKVGTLAGEDKFIQNPNPAIPGVMTREQAVARKAELMADTAWTAKYLAGDAAANRELQSLLVLIVGDDTGRSRAA